MSFHSRVQHGAHILWGTHSEGALLFQESRLSLMEQIIPEQLYQTAKVICESLGDFFFPVAWNISVLSKSFMFSCQIQHHSQQAWTEADDPSKLVAELTGSAKGWPAFVPSNIKSSSCTHCWLDLHLHLHLAVNTIDWGIIAFICFMAGCCTHPEGETSALLPPKNHSITPSLSYRCICIM